MKRLFVVMLALVIGVGAVCAQQKKEVKNRATVTFATNLDCENCAKKILDVIPFKKGVKDVVVDVPTKAVTVTYDPRKTNETALAEALWLLQAEGLISLMSDADMNAVIGDIANNPLGLEIVTMKEEEVLKNLNISAFENLNPS